jgi:methyl-accepting chemotaxis protein
VIAEEIRKLSAQSKSNAEQIAVLTEQIGLKMGQVTSASVNSSRKSNEQAEATQQMVAAIEEVAGLAERLAGIAKSLA